MILISENHPLNVFLKYLYKSLFQDHEKSKTDDEGSSEEEIDESHMELFSKITRNGSTYDRIVKRIEEIMRKPTSEETQPDLCIIGCGRKKNTALLPCRHQPICDKCWFIWSTKSIQNQAFSFEKDIMPTCPVCREPVDEPIKLSV